MRVIPKLLRNWHYNGQRDARYQGEGLILAKISSILKQEPMAEDIDRELVRAAGDGDLQRVKSLILQGADVNERDGEAFTSAAEFNYLDILAYLYTQGVEEYIQYDAFIEAAGNGSLEAVKFLSSVGSIDHDSGARALRRAALNGYLDVVMFLTSSGYRMDTAQIARVRDPEVREFLLGITDTVPVGGDESLSQIV